MPIPDIVTSLACMEGGKTPEERHANEHASHALVRKWLIGYGFTPGFCGTQAMPHGTSAYEGHFGKDDIRVFWFYREGWGNRHISKELYIFKNGKRQSLNWIIRAFESSQEEEYTRLP